MDTRQWISVIVACATVAGCEIAAKVNARDDMEKSKAAYKGCLIAHSSNTGACEGYRLAYDADMRAYRAETAGTQPGVNDTINIVPQN